MLLSVPLTLDGVLAFSMFGRVDYTGLGYAARVHPRFPNGASDMLQINLKNWLV